MGAKLVTSQEISPGIEMLPRIEFGIEDHFNNKSKNSKTKYAVSQKYFEPSYTKDAKIQYNLGAGVVLRNETIELSLSYNAKLYRQYENHQGTLKIKVMF